MNVEKLKHGDWRGWVTDNAADISVVNQLIDRDDTGIYYEVRVTLRSLEASAVEEGESQICVWCDCVDFGQTDATVAGGSAFVQMAREQTRIAETIAAIARLGAS